ncbi:imidazolonepropionase [Candidatus Berkiella aquae]|uniref:imidazolonepropionase n=1 Tax=Candidatus Berkiella aquae TaxID=295108 RepID=UPI0040553A98
MQYAIWQDATLITMNSYSDYGLIEKGAIVVEQGKIIWVGPEQALPNAFTKQAEIHSANGHFITPGLIDCHTHLVYSGNRVSEFEARLQGVKKGGILTTVAATREANFTVLYEAAAKRLQQMLEAGVTTVEIKSGYGLQLEAERKILQVARALSENFPVTIQNTFLGAHVLPSEFENKQQYIRELVDNVLPLLLQEGLVDAVDGFCETGAFSAIELESLYTFAKQNNMPIKVHAEQLSRGEGAHLAARFKAVSADHLEYLDEAGVIALKSAGCTAVLLPGAYYFLQQDQKPPIELLRKYQVPMALATDCNPGTSPTTSLLLMMNMGCLLFKLTPLEALQAVTLHAASALNLAHCKGKLAIGYDADFVLWNIQSPTELAYHFGDNCCEKVVKQGKVAYAR